MTPMGWKARTGTTEPRGRMMNRASQSRSFRTSVPVIAERIEALDWQCIAASLDADGCAVISTVLSPKSASRSPRSM